ncbi:Cytochrome P450 2B19 [Nymphon striatum]|nr:Cytochrome P450 2B19 [Nymphon striatum]
MKSVTSVVLITAAHICYLFGYFNYITTLLCTASAILLLFLKDRDEYNYPPGPIDWPIIGRLPWMILKGPLVYVMELKQQYGKIFMMHMGPSTMIFLNDYDTIKELTNHPDFQGRPQVGITFKLHDEHGIILSEGDRWKHQRRFVLHALRDFGMGKMSMQDMIIEEFQHLVDEIKKANGEPLSMDTILQKSTCNIIFSTAFGKRYEYEDPDFIERIENLNHYFGIAAKTGILDSKSNDSIIEHKKSLDENNPRDLIDLFLIEMKKKIGDEDGEYLSTFTEKQLRITILDLFLAGTETSSTTMRWALLYMLYYPDIQKKVQDEIDEFVGLQRPPTVEDKSNLPFTTATLQEIERIACLVPWGVARSNPKVAEFKGYKLPARCVFQLNIQAVHMDEKLWKNPKEFNPTRFINPDGKVFRPPYLIPFGSGKRNCAGEPLARMELFLLFVTLMQNFKFTKAGETLPKMDYNIGGVRSPKTILLLFLKDRDEYKYPPGPIDLPIIGRLPWMILKGPLEYVMELKQQYGKIFMMHMGPSTMIFLNDYDTIKEFTNHPDFQGRPQRENYDKSKENISEGIHTTHGIGWQVPDDSAIARPSVPDTNIEKNRAFHARAVPLPVVKINPHARPPTLPKFRPENQLVIRENQRELFLWKTMRTNHGLSQQIVPRFIGHIIVTHSNPMRPKTDMTFLPPIMRSITDYRTVT